MRPAIVATEKQDMKAVLDWLSWQRRDGKPLVFHHVPNEKGRRGPPRLGVRAGVPDILVYTPPILQPGPFGGTIRYYGAAVELKRAHGGRVTEEQLRWLEELRDRCQWATKLCEGCDEAIAFLTPLYVPERR